jgi:hypothetical protein
VDIDLNLLPLGGGTAVFSESHSGVSVVGGLFSLKIGGVNDMSAVSFDAAYELELTVDGDLLSPNTPLCSAPYALGVVGGAQGPQGKQGPAGSDGNDGAAGTAGTAGTQGAQGKQGDPGPVGSEFWDGDIAGDIYKVNSGNVGIGTSSPTGLLHISGSEPSAIRMSGTRPTYGPRDYLFGLQAGNLSTGDPGMRLQTVDATAGLIRTILDAQGFFGIGDLTPAVRLHVNESPNGAGELGKLLRITGYEPRMEIEATRNNTTWTIGGNMSGLDDNGMRLVIGNNHMGTAMAINQVGRVGIGAETPVAKLHVMEMPENSGDQGLLLRLTGREPRMELEAQRTGVTWSIAANYTGGDQGMRLRIANSDSGPALTINQPGRVGIGTDVPSAKLDVVGNIQSSTALVVNNGAGGNWHYRLNGSTLEWFENQVIGRVNMSLTLGGQLAVFDGIQAGGSGYKINGDNAGAGNWDMKLGNGGDLVWYENATYGAERMRLKKNGNLGVANDNPGQMFQVAGAYCTGAQWVDVSTRDAKKNIEPLSLDVALQTLSNLDPVTFEYKDARTPDGHVGFIAEDVPEIVATPDRKGLVSMDIVGVLTAVVKEQQKQMEIMRAELTELKATVQP